MYCIFTPKLFFESFFGTHVEFQYIVLSGQLRWSKWVMWALLGNRIIIWRLRQQARKHLCCREGGRGSGGTCPCEGALLCWVLFISHMENGTFWTGTDLTHSHTVPMRSGQQLLSGANRKCSYRNYLQHENRYIKLVALWTSVNKTTTNMQCNKSFSLFVCLFRHSYMHIVQDL